uniref:Putative paraquat-inducible protein B ( pqiB) n=1 Tax=Magnetococcus massalia (strain MO-1) TaxID=451514 RepID=A0A1S7LKX1_MAGMO|nr:putative paraquat-inducible protein B \
MTQHDLSALPEPISPVESRRKLHWIWLLPLLAMSYVIWLAIDHINQLGPEITVIFDDASGIQPGKTSVKYKSVEVGQVTHLQLHEDLSNVEVTIRLNPKMADHLSPKTRFWVVRPRLSIREVSGLETIVSGIYIAMDPVKTGENYSTFMGLEKPPFLQTKDAGRRYLLSADSLGSLTRGVPILYRGIKVGQVLGHDLDTEGDRVLIHIFIRKPYHHKVQTNSRFWNTSGLDFKMDADGMRLSTQSMESLLAGGIAFDSPSTLDKKAESKTGSLFPLYPNQEATEERIYSLKKLFVLFFDASVRGLNVGAPVEMRGIRVGRVKDIKMRYEEGSSRFPIAVLVEIEPARITGKDQLPAAGDGLLEALIEQGLRARLKTGSLLTGQLLVDLDWHPDTAVNLAGLPSPYRELPTLPSEFAEITNAIKEVLTTIRKLPLQEIAEELQGTVAGVNRIVNGRKMDNAIEAMTRTMNNLESLSTELSAEMPKAAKQLNGAMLEMQGSLQQATKTLSTVETVIAQDAPLHDRLVDALGALEGAAVAIQTLATALEKDPQSLLFGRTP